MKSNADHIIDPAAEAILRLPSLKADLARFENSDCRNCWSLRIKYLRKQIDRIEQDLAVMRPRLRRLAEKHAANLRAKRASFPVNTSPAAPSSSGS